MTNTSTLGAGATKLIDAQRAWRRAALVGLVVIAGAFGGIAAWASLAPLSSAVIAPGFVTVDTNRKKVQHLDGGIVNEILVRDGDKVRKGQVMIRLDETRARASSGIVQAARDAAKAQEARLVAERDGDDQIDFPASLLARQLDPTVAELMTAQRSLFFARRAAIEGETALLEQRVGQLNEEIEGLTAQRRSNERQLAFIADELGGLRQLWKNGLVEKSRLMALERESARLEGEKGQRIAEIARTKTAIGETKLKIVQLRKTMHESVATEIRDVQAQIFDLDERLNAAEHVLKNIEIKAPVDGIVVGLGVHTEGGVIKAGDTVLEVVPIGDSLLIEAQMQATDIDNTQIGQEADIHFTALSQRTTPVLIGQVTYVSADRLTDPRNGQPFYLVRVSVSESEVQRLGDQHLVPGMPAEVIIKTGERTAGQYLLQPMLSSFRRAWREE